MIDWDTVVLAPVMGVFGEDQLPVYIPASGAPQFDLADAVFDREFLQQQLLEDGSETVSRRSVVGVRLALFAVPPVENDKIYFPSVGLTFIVRQVEPDGHGFAKLLLQKT